MAAKKAPAEAEAVPIRVASRRTGLSPEILRIWERRYEAVVPIRTGTGRRLYSEADLRRLTLLREATQLGHRIGDLTDMSTPDLRALLEKERSAAPPEASRSSEVAAGAFLEDALDAVRNLDSRSFHRALQHARLTLDGRALTDDLLAPLFERIGALWESGKLAPAHEHLATAGVHAMLMNALESQDRAGAPVILITTPSGQRHEVGALLASLAAATVGWRVVYLGADLPGTEIAEAARKIRAQAVGLSIVTPPDGIDLSAELRQLGSRLPEGTRLIVGGRASGEYREAVEAAGGQLCADLPGFRKQLSELPVSSR